MAEHKILIAGLPNAGKTSYIAALNGVIRQGYSKTLTYDDLPTDGQYLNKMTGSWLKREKVLRSPSEKPHYMKWPLKRIEDNLKLEIDIPDFKGEMFEDIIKNDIDDELKTYCENATGILFFINAMEDIVLKGKVKEIITDQTSVASKSEAKRTGDKILMNVERMTDISKNILVLKYLRELLGDFKLVVIVSSWDEECSKYKTIENYFTKKCPGLYNYICFNFTKFKLYGVSAQGYNYELGPEEPGILPSDDKRAYVFDTERRDDLSYPLNFLINEE